MFRRFTSALAALVLLGGLLSVAAATTPRGGARKCRMRGMPDCCKKMLARTGSPQLGSTPPCCAARRPQPAPPARGFTFQHAPESNVSPCPPEESAHALPPSSTRARDSHPPPRTHAHSPPAYIQHSALLI